MTKEPKMMTYNAEGIFLTSDLFDRYTVELVSHCHRGNRTSGQTNPT